jgi:hypothetical protein
MMIDPAVPVDERTDSFLPFPDTATPHATVSGQACTMTRMHGQFFFLSCVSSARARHLAHNKTTDAENVNKDMSQERANQENYRADAHAVMQ